MTSKQVYEASAIELSKIQAPTLKLYEFNYFFNQAIRQFVNKIYNIYDINQQTTDDLRVLKATATLLPRTMPTTGNPAVDYLQRGTYYVDMPDDYLHLLNCICLFNVNKAKDCWNAGDTMVVGATKMTADSWSSIVDDVYNRPSKKRPYYYIHNQNKIELQEGKTDIAETSNTLPSNKDTDSLHASNRATLAKIVDTAVELSKQLNVTKLLIINAVKPLAADDKYILDKLSAIEKDSTITDAAGTVLVIKNIKPNFEGFSRTFDFDGSELSSIEKPAGSRYANSSLVRVEIRCGRDRSNIFDLAAVQIDYVKAPQYIRLTQEELDSDEDISQVLEFPDYVNQEIINELVNLVMRKNNDPSLQAHMLMTLSIARPTGQLAQ